ncbi:cyclic pyranopterin monophosphate synthase MoaC [Anaerobium acetethylicum]|uniref:Cyclic pyranopterin phosphate synthase n=1 Tax=Anaerobium acetethylicum TaxID=1619234 RepID=A0A1D3TTK8_9FIRM|nr:cyclic pyranopterin monophosphate synthase MoaC [Anaerobium acetethylicum]SCP97273.1 cyclic pyranopterin phosphate synthase [Anaerobium acetethylicum]
MSRLSHFDDEGNAIMVDVSCEEVTVRTAVAKDKIRINGLVMEAVTEHRLEKGDVLGVARVAGIIATKQRVEEKNEI